MSVEPSSIITFTMLTSEAICPIRKTAGSAGLDLATPIDFILFPGCQQLVKLGIRADIPKGCYGRIAPRSGLGMKGINVHAGVIDCDYEGEVGVILINHGKENISFVHGDRIAQMIIERIEMPFVRAIKFYNPNDVSLGSGNVADEIMPESTSIRGSGGFGSTDS